MAWDHTGSLTGQCSDKLIGTAGISVGNTLAPLAAVSLLRTVDFHTPLDRLRDVMALVFLGALASMTASATVGAVTLLWSGSVIGGAFWPTWSVWWAGDAMGVLIVARGGPKPQSEGCMFAGLGSIVEIIVLYQCGARIHHD